MNDLYRITTVELKRFLSKHLPTMSDDWWEKHVLDKLTFPQQRQVQEQGYSRLRQLDLAALLRVFDQNWFDLQDNLKLPREGRNWVKELQTMRNRWAHQSIEETSANDQYRDADTLVRLLDLLDAEEGSRATVERAKLAALAAMVPKVTVPEEAIAEEQPSTKSESNEAPASVAGAIKPTASINPGRTPGMATTPSNLRPQGLKQWDRFIHSGVLHELRTIVDHFQPRGAEFGSSAEAELTVQKGDGTMTVYVRRHRRRHSSGMPWRIGGYHMQNQYFATLPEVIEWMERHGF